jgi:hypothetical protein
MARKSAPKTPVKTRGAKSRQLSEADRFRLQQAQTLIDEYNRSLIPRKGKTTP